MALQHGAVEGGDVTGAPHGAETPATAARQGPAARLFLVGDGDIVGGDGLDGDEGRPRA